MAEFFQHVPNISFEGAQSANPYAFKHYDKDEVVLGKTMESQLRFAQQLEDQAAPSVVAPVAQERLRAAWYRETKHR